MMCELCTLDRVVIRPEKRSKKFCRFFYCGEENFVELPAIERKYGQEMKQLARLMLKDPGYICLILTRGGFCEISIPQKS